MDCNREEAIRAKGIAEKKMKDKNFVSARKFALKAQQLYPELEDISQMILVCEVHCSAQTKVCGNEKDWYGILKIDQNADECSVRKQYKNLALLLHPDKNKFSGATDAFKLISEAQMVLLNRDKRILYDSKISTSRKYRGRSQSMQQTSRDSETVEDTAHKCTNLQRQQHKSRPAADRPTFWTVCTACHVRYQYYRDVMHKRLQCQNCKNVFVAVDINAPGGKPGNKSSRSVREDISRQCHVDSSHSNLPTGFQSKPGNKNWAADSSCRTTTSDIEGSKVNLEELNKMPLPGGTESMPGKKRKVAGKVASGEGLVIEENGDSLMGVQNVNNHGEGSCRSIPLEEGNFCRSSTENEVEVLNFSKRSKQNGPDFSKGDGKTQPADVSKLPNEVKEAESSSCEILDNEDGGQKTIEEMAQEAGKCCKEAPVPSNLGPSFPISPESYEYPDPDFSDFDKDRKLDHFKAGQIWAVYDNVSAMPRFYVLVQKVLFPGFRLQITWLEANPSDESEIKWVEEGLPTSCGEFRLGYSENTEDLLMFSHLVSWEMDSRRDSFRIFPRKGETWALFKNWDINWNLETRKDQNYKYEFVEVLTNYSSDSGVQVNFLDKVEGFACIFRRTTNIGKISVRITHKEIFRFSHRIPSFKMTGKEREDVPEGAFELDPASLPANLEGVSSSQCSGTKVKGMHTDDSSIPAANQKKASEQVRLASEANKVPPSKMIPHLLSERNDHVNSLRRSLRHWAKDRAGDIACQNKSLGGSGSSGKGNLGKPSSAQEQCYPNSTFYDFDVERSSE